jgi:hypothetical protein
MWEEQTDGQQRREEKMQENEKRAVAAVQITHPKGWDLLNT